VERANANPRITDAGMNAMAPPFPLTLENVPFSTQQRAWLNGFLGPHRHLHAAYADEIGVDAITRLDRELAGE
jgi:hypothetical protein